MNKSGGTVQLQDLTLRGGSTFSIDAGDTLTRLAEVYGTDSILNLNQAVALSDQLFAGQGAVINAASTLTMQSNSYGVQLNASTFNAGGDVTVIESSYGVGLNNGSIFHLNGHTLTATSPHLGFNFFVLGADGAGTFDRGSGGTVQLQSLNIHKGSQFTLEAGDNVTQSILVRDVGSSFDLNGNSINLDSVLLSFEGRLVGSGTVAGAVNNETGVVAPGNTAGVISITGTFSQSSGTLEIELGGTDNSNPIAPEFDQIVVDGTACRVACWTYRSSILSCPVWTTLSNHHDDCGGRGRFCHRHSSRVGEWRRLACCRRTARLCLVCCSGLAGRLQR